MWAETSLDDAVAAEAAVEEFYTRALNAWAAEIEPLVLPSLTASGELPPEPDAADQGTALALWEQIGLGLVVLGGAVVWARSYMATRDEPDEDERENRRRDAEREDDQDMGRVRSALIAAVGAKAAKSWIADYRAARRDRKAKAAMDRYTEAARESAARVPSNVRDKLAAAIKDVTDPVQVRVKLREVVVPDSPELRDLARMRAHDAAGAQNAAVVEAALAEGGEGLQKVWIATLDSRTRRTHWAADGQRVALDATFAIGRDDLRYPADHRGSDAETRNCRCRVGIIKSDDDLPSDTDRHTERLDGRDSTAKNREGSQADEIERRKADDNPRARDTASLYAAGGGWAAPSEEISSMDPNETTATLAADDEATEVESEGGEMFRTFTDSVVAVTGEHTSDGRMLAADIDLRFRTMPLPLMWVKQSSMGHLDAFTVGVIESARVEDGKVLASGYLMNSSESDEAAEQIAHGITGPSVDLADTEWVLTDEDGNEISEEEWWDLPMDAKVYQTVTSAELIGTTLVSTPAFGQTTISLNSEREARDVALVASAAGEYTPKVYDHRLFEDPQLPGPTLPTFDEKSGRVYGHLACFGQCHRSVQTECVIAPRSASNYSHFHTSPAVRLDNGERLPVGRLTVGGGHANDRLGFGPAVAHYDSTGSAFALVRVGEDEHGIWFSGVPAPWATAEQIEEGMSAPLSGDWRAVGGHLELIAALAVNTPGFVARGTSDHQGRPASLVASLGPSEETAASAGFSREQVADIVRETLRQTHAEQAKAQRAVDVSGLLSQVPDTRAEDRKAEIDGLFAQVGE
ncbi:capsid maturation protease and MuF-like fusion protein [Gordonia phage NHagos]|nr:capsid maturation protease and MuF-like fusion protein [Gordonia phage NHagos]